MVRLKGTAASVSELLNVTFQFHIGTIKRDTNLVLYNIYFYNFNSILVRLKVQAVQKLYGSALKFQFHIGTIKSYSVIDYGESVSTFQFHIGTIKSRELSNIVTLTGSISIPYWYD